MMFRATYDLPDGSTLVIEADQSSVAVSLDAPGKPLLVLPIMTACIVGMALQRASAIAGAEHAKRDARAKGGSRHRAIVAADKERLRQVVRDVAYRTLDLGITSLDPDTARIADAIATRCADEICTHKETP